jgi:hypothetical protein
MSAELRSRARPVVSSEGKEKPRGVSKAAIAEGQQRLAIWASSNNDCSWPTHWGLDQH